MRNLITNMLLAGLFTLLFLGCSSHDNTLQLTAINETLVNACQNQVSINNNIYSTFIDKSNDAVFKSKAMIWRPRADRIKMISSETVNYIEKILNDFLQRSKQTVVTDSIIFDKDNSSLPDIIFFKEGKANELIAKLQSYRANITSAIDTSVFFENPTAKKYFIARMDEFNTSLPVSFFIEHYVINKNSSANSDIIFKDLTTIKAVILLNKLKYDVLLSENEVISYFNDMCSAMVESYEKFSAIVSLNSFNFRSGQTLSITAGMGTFTFQCRPKISIQGKEIPVNEDGVSIYSKKIFAKPGRYNIPVKIEYIKPDGSPAILIRNIEYIVSE